MEIKKPNKTFVSIAITGIFVAASAGVFYLFFLKGSVEEIWYDASWSYRRTVYIEDIPKEYQGFEHDVLIEVDTRSMIKENKLTENCRDIRLVDEDSRRTLKYWIEGGCNTDKTQIWTRILLPNSDEKMIYLYYGNKLATDGQEDWDGQFISVSTDQCQSHWEKKEEFKGRFPYIENSYNRLDGNGNHRHEIFRYSGNNCEAPVHVLDNHENQSCDPNQNNIVSGFSTYLNNIPDYVNVNFCASQNGYLTNDLTALSSLDIPKGWTPVSRFDGKYPRGDDKEEPTAVVNHLHTISCENTDLPVADESARYLSLDKPSRTIPTQLEPTYYSVKFINSPDENPIPRQALMMVSSLPPLGWDNFEEADNSLLRGSQDKISESGGSDIHYHIPTISLSLKRTSLEEIKKFDTKEVCIFNYLRETDQSSEESILPPYITVRLAQKKIGLIGKISVTLSENETTLQEVSRGEVLGTYGSGPSQPSGLETQGETNPEYLIDSDIPPGFTAIFNHPDYP